MADLAQTSANVAQGANAKKNGDLVAGEAINAGDLLYQHTDQKLYKALNDTEAHAGLKGMALNPAAIGQTVVFQFGGDINPGAGTTVVVGELYGVSVNAGKVAPVGDLGTGKYRTIFGYGVTPSSIRMAIDATGIVRA